MIKRLTIENFRVFTEETIEPSSRLNLLFGDNATGKTSILEAIGILSTLRSFRGAKLSELVKFKQDGFRITATVEGTGGRDIPLGLERRNGEVTLKAEGRKVHKVSELAIKMPVQIIHPDSHLLISGGPKQRRRFLDWGVFHVEHQGFLECWKRYEKALRQRNASIRSQNNWKTVCTWDKGISDAAMVIDRYRQRYIEDLNTILPEFTRDISGTEKVEIEYQPGWDTSRELWQLLEENRERDRRRGFTCLGPHRAELVFKVDGMPAERHISRGQQKMLVFSLLLSQVELFKRRTGNSCILLLDDLAAELDRKHRDSLLGILRGMSVQIFVTSVQRDSICMINWDQHKLFHVEHGKTTEVI
jgi:DNA replication and repair protein RecF